MSEQRMGRTFLGWLAAAAIVTAGFGCAGDYVPDDDSADDDDSSPSTTDADGDGFSPAEGDCDDEDPDVNPLADEVCNGLDDDCNDRIDEVFDADQDWYTTCGEDGIEGTPDDDCDDIDPLINPGAPDTFGDGEDTNCDGADGVDADYDGFPDGAQGGTDCDDADPDSYPGAEEQCDGADNDCNGTIDDVDNDGDGYLDADCSGDDCDDDDPAIHPGAEEVCDHADSDCDGATPDDEDLDGDGYTLCTGECDDTDPMANPSVPEDFGNGIDDNCDGRVDVLYDHGSSLDQLTALHGEWGEADFWAMDAGDLDGDGARDLIALARDDVAPQFGYVYRYEGRFPWPPELDHTQSNGGIEGESGQATFECAAVGDVDDDGFDDLFCHVGDELCLWPGGANPIPPASSYLDVSACVGPDPSQPAWQLHEAIPLGDLDGDGVDDVAFSWGDTTTVLSDTVPRPRELRLFFGGPGWSDTTVTASDADLYVYESNRVNTRVQVAEVDGDGWLDLLVCQGSHTGNVRTETRLFYGGAGRWTAGMQLGDRDARFTGTRYDGHGRMECVRSPGDVDGDGRPDLHYEALQQGDRFVFGDGSRWTGDHEMSSYTFQLTLPDLTEKTALAEFLDINDDGRADVAVGLARDYGTAGEVHLHTGRIGMIGTQPWSTGAIRFTGPGATAEGGTALASVGDVTGDGIDDLLIGADEPGPGEPHWWYLAAGFSGPDPGLTDDDGDGYKEFQGDCDDTDPARHPGATEPDDLTDWNCDGQITDPGVHGATLGATLYVSLGAFSGTLTLTYLDGIAEPMCTHQFDIGGAAASGNYVDVCPECAERWTWTLTDTGDSCSFDPANIGLADAIAADLSTLWATDVLPEGYCVADDCAGQPIETVLAGIEAQGIAPVIYVFGPDLFGVGHAEFLGVLESSGGNPGLPVSGNYVLYSPWSWDI